jgi:hypothetical protein
MSNQILSADEWLHILSKAIANYAAAGGAVSVMGNRLAGLPPQVGIYLSGLDIEDDRLHADFVALVDSEPDIVGLMLGEGQRG